MTTVEENYRPPFIADQDTNMRTEYTYDLTGNRVQAVETIKGVMHPKRWIANAQKYSPSLKKSTLIIFDIPLMAGGLCARPGNTKVSGRASTHTPVVNRHAKAHFTQS